MGNRTIQRQATPVDGRLGWSGLALAGLILLAVGVAAYVIGGTPAHRPTVPAEPLQERLSAILTAPNLAQRAGEPSPPAGEKAVNPEALSLEGHQGAVRVVAFSQDSRWLATVSDDDTARLWDLAAPDPAAVPFVLGGHRDWISAAAFSPNGRWLVTASWDGTARVWDLRSPDPSTTPLVLRGHRAPIGAVAFSPDNRWLVTASGDSTARLWDVSALLNTGVSTLLPGPVRTGNTGVSASLPGPARAGNTGVSASLKPGLTAPCVLRGHEGAVLAVAFSPDGRWLVTASQEGTARLWDLTILDPAAASTSANSLDRPGQAAEPLVLGGHGFGVNGVAFSPDSRWLVTASWEGIARLWDISTLLNTSVSALFNNTGLTASDPADASRLLFGHKFWISALVFSPDGHWLATAGVDDTARLWDLTAPDPADAPFVLLGHRDWIIAAAFSPDNRWLATASADGTARLWDVTSPDPSAIPLALCGHRDWINVVTISPDSHWLVTGSRDGGARLWDLRTPDPTAASLLLGDHQGAVLDAAFSPDGRWLVIADGDGTVRLWDLRLEEMPDL